MARALPACVVPAWLDAVDEAARSALGREDRTGTALEVEVAKLSEVYTRRTALRDGPRSPGALAARLRFFLPRDLAKARAPVEELVRAGALPRRETWRVLDAGAGLGATSLGALAALRETGLAGSAELVALDDDARALSVLEALVAAAAKRGLIPQTRVTVRRADLARGVPREPGGPGEVPPFDLVVAGFVLNELFADARAEDALAKRVALVLELATRLAPGGALIALEPALRDTARSFHALRDAIAARRAPPYVAAPCLRDGPCPMLETERDWCHEDLPLALPPPLVPVARAAGLRFEGLTYSYVTLRNEPGALFGEGARGVPLRVVSDLLVSKGKRELFGCGAPGRVRLVRLDRSSSIANAALEDARRGDVLDVAPLATDAKLHARIAEDTSVAVLSGLVRRL